MNPMQLTLFIRLIIAGLKSLRDDAIENVVGIALDYLAHESCRLTFLIQLLQLLHS